MCSFFGFTGTPIQDENSKKMNTTSTVFGSELHRYSIADGIHDKNVLGFEPYKVMTFKDSDVRKKVALYKAKANDETEVMADDKKKEIYYKYMDNAKVKMAGYRDDRGKYIKGIEDYLPTEQYRTDEHRQMVIKDIVDNWVTLSHGGKFHAIFATSSIVEAIEYYRLLKEEKKDLKITALFDPNIDNNGGAIVKEDGLCEIIEDYNKAYGQDFSIASFAKMKKDIAARLSHKDPYLVIERSKDKQIDLLIVVDQMLTGFDSKWINTLYMDKLMEFENIIQAFSRTNRLFGADKPFGTIRYYRRPHKMEQNIKDAVKLYSGNRPLALFVQKLGYNLKNINDRFKDIEEVFKDAGIPDFEKLPEDMSVCGKFASLFNELNEYLEAAKIQGFTWDNLQYTVEDEQTHQEEIVQMLFDKKIYLILLLRYKELFDDNSPNNQSSSVPFDMKGYLTQMDTGRIDADYMNSRFEKYLKILETEGSKKELVESALNELHKSFASLTQEEQKYANIFLHDIQRGDVTVEEGKSLMDYITEYQTQASNDQISKVVDVFGLDESKFRKLLNLHVTNMNINEYGRFDELKASVDKAKARAYFESVKGEKIKPFEVNIKVDKILKKFILSGGFDIDEK